MRDLAEIYHTKYAFMGIFSDEKQTAIRTQAVWADGQWGEQTATAVQQFQVDTGLAVTGQLDERVLDSVEI